MWYSLSKFKNDEIQIKENKKFENDSISISDSESDYSEIYSDDEDDCKSIYHQLIIHHNKLKFDNFNLKLISNRVDYPDDMLSENDISSINTGILIYQSLLDL